MKFTPLQAKTILVRHFNRRKRNQDRIDYAVRRLMEVK